MKVAFVGGGVMGEAMLSAILKKGVSTGQAICVADASQSRCTYIGKEYSIRATLDNKEAVQGADVVVLAIKPQNLAKVLADLSGKLKPEQLVVSIIAGAKISTIGDGLKHNCIVRAMPNTPAQIGEGMTVWTATSSVTKEQKERAASILGAMGKEIFAEDEKYIDMATALSGSGPAYVFLFIESLVDAGVHTGMPRAMATELALQTVLGSAKFLQNSGKSPAELRGMVTSPGGTTIEALFRLEKGGFTGLVMEAVMAAYEKAKKLGG